MAVKVQQVLQKGAYKQEITLFFKHFWAGGWYYQKVNCSWHLVGTNIFRSVYIKKLWLYVMNLQCCSQCFPKVTWRNSARKARYIWEVSGRNATAWCGTMFSTTSGKRKQTSKQDIFCCQVTKHKWLTREGVSLPSHIQKVTGHTRYILVKSVNISCRQISLEADKAVLWCQPYTDRTFLTSTRSLSPKWIALLGGRFI